MKNKLSDLNNYLFAQLEHLGNEDLTGEALTPSHEWYRPEIKQVKKLEKNWPGSIDHVRRGWLMLREIKAETA